MNLVERTAQLRGCNPMRESTKDRVQGKAHEIKGKVKETTGKALNNPRVAIEGQNEKIAGKVQEKVGQAKRVLEK